MGEPKIQDAVYRIIREGIMTLNLQPGSMISTQEIATKLNVSRTPVREAFIKLEREGLLFIFPQRESVVSKINLDRVEQELFIRSSLELAVGARLKHYKRDLMFGKLSENLIESEACLENNDCKRFLELDNAFHEILFTTVRERLGWETIMSVNGHYNRLRFYMIKEAGQMPLFLEEHKQLFKAVRAEEWNQVEQLISGHFRGKMDKKKLLAARPDYFEDNDGRSRFGVLGTL